MASLGILKCSCHIVWSGKLVSSAIEIYTRINMEIRWIRYHAKISFVYIAYFVSMLFQYFLGKYLNKAFNGIFVYMLCIVTQEHTKLFSLLEFAFLLTLNRRMSVCVTTLCPFSMVYIGKNGSVLCISLLNFTISISMNAFPTPAVQYFFMSYFQTTNKK